MTEADWLGCFSTERLLRWMPTRLDERRWRLLACGICRQFAPFPGDEPFRALLDAAEDFADGNETLKRLDALERKASRASRELARAALDLADALGEARDGSTSELLERSIEAGRVAGMARMMEECGGREVEEFYNGFTGRRAREVRMLERVRQLLFEEHPEVAHDVLGNPFRNPVIDPGWFDWGEGLIRRLATNIYVGRHFEDLPILGDALEDAGCADAAILSHCHKSGPHVRGCWVLDCLLGFSREARSFRQETLVSTWPEKYCTSLEPVIGQGGLDNGDIWLSLRLESANLPEAVQFVSEVDPETLPEEERQHLARALPSIVLGLRQRLGEFSCLGRPLACACVSIMGIRLDEPLPLDETFRTLAYDTLDRLLDEAVLVPLEATSRGPARTGHR